MFHLVCIHEFAGYKKGDMVTDQDEVARLYAQDREHHFVRITARPVKRA